MRGTPTTSGCIFYLRRRLLAAADVEAALPSIGARCLWGFAARVRDGAWRFAVPRPSELPQGE